MPKLPTTLVRRLIRAYEKNNIPTDPATEALFRMLRREYAEWLASFWEGRADEAFKTTAAYVRSIIGPPPHGTQAYAAIRRTERVYHGLRHE